MAIAGGLRSAVASHIEGHTIGAVFLCTGKATMLARHIFTAKLVIRDTRRLNAMFCLAMASAMYGRMISARCVQLKAIYCIMLVKMICKVFCRWAAGSRKLRMTSDQVKS